MRKMPEAVYNINIGGLISSISSKSLTSQGYNSLCSIIGYPSSPLAEGIMVNERDEFYIDGDSESLDVLLNYLRGYPVPENDTDLLNKVRYDAKRFGIHGLVSRIDEILGRPSKDDLVCEIKQLKPSSKVYQSMDYDYLATKLDRLRYKKQKLDINEMSNVVVCKAIPALLDYLKTENACEVKARIQCNTDLLIKVSNIFDLFYEHRDNPVVQFFAAVFDAFCEVLQIHFSEAMIKDLESGKIDLSNCFGSQDNDDTNCCSGDSCSLSGNTTTTITDLTEIVVSDA
jgi:hypothetical protein